MTERERERERDDDDDDDDDEEKMAYKNWAAEFLWLSDCKKSKHSECSNVNAFI